MNGGGLNIRHEKANYLFLFDRFHPKLHLFSPVHRRKPKKYVPNFWRGNLFLKNIHPDESTVYFPELRGNDF